MRKLLTLLAFAVVVAGCGAPATTTNAPAANVASVSGPSAPARMVCAADAQREISLSLGQSLRQPVAPNYADHLYSCDYVYPAGTVTLSVKELSTVDTATAYFASSRTTAAVPGLGQAAYAEPDGSLVVRKDAMVLRVDVHGLPTEFGQPSMSRTEAARRIAADIMRCWTGS